MDKREFLKLSGLLSLGAVVPFKGAFAGDDTPLDGCTLIPTETAGPFPLDITANTTYFRSDIRESQAGVQLNVKLKILGLDNCEAMENVRVNIWHCNKGGSYSGYSTSDGNTSNEVGETFLRGWQMTDANGEVEFITILPGWYSGRVCHIHFQVYVSSSYAAISQLTFPVDTKNAIYVANSSIYTKGADPLTPASDGIFSDGYTYQMATLTPNTSTGGYDSYLEVTVNGSGTTGIGHIENQNAKNFSLGQNFPNPHSGKTTIPFSLVKRAKVNLEIYNLMGRKIAQPFSQDLSAGEHQVAIDFNNLGLANGNYVYQIEVVNDNGTFRDCKMMTALK